MALQAPASGNTATVEFSPQLEATIPALEGTFEGFRINTTGNWNLVRTEEDDAQLDPTGFMRPMIPSTIRASSPELNILLTAGHFLPFAHHFFGGLIKSLLVGGGGWEYLFTGDASAPDYGFTVVVGLPPVETYARHTMKFSDVEIVLGGTTALVSKFTGDIVHGQSYDFSVADVGNTGIYGFAPSIRGPSRFRELGDIYVEISTSVAPDFRFRAEITDGVPTFPGIEFDINVCPASSRGDWANLQGAIKLPGTFTVGVNTTVTADVAGVARLFKYLRDEDGNDRVGMSVQVGAETHAVASVTSDDEFEIAVAHTGAGGITVHMLGQDFGFWGENFDPVELVFQGDATDFADLDVGDQWSFLSTIPARNPTFTTHQRFTAAHVVHFFREVGASQWIPFPGLTSTLKGSWPLETEEGLGSRYLTALDRTGRMVWMLDPFDAVHRPNNFQFIEWAESHRRLEAKVEILGRPLGDGSAREGFIITFPNGSITSQDRPIDTPDRLTITNTITGTTDKSGVQSPAIFRINSPLDWTAPVIIS